MRYATGIPPTDTDGRSSPTETTTPSPIVDRATFGRWVRRARSEPVTATPKSRPRAGHVRASLLESVRLLLACAMLHPPYAASIAWLNIQPPKLWSQCPNRRAGASGSTTAVPRHIPILEGGRSKRLLGPRGFTEANASQLQRSRHPYTGERWLGVATDQSFVRRLPMQQRLIPTARIEAMDRGASSQGV